MFLAYGERARALALLEKAASNPNVGQVQRDQVGTWLIRQVSAQLERAAHLTPERRVRIALDIDAEAVMHGDTAADAEVFLTKWRRGRYVLHVAGVINGSEAILLDLRNQGVQDFSAIVRALLVNARRDMNDLLEKRRLHHGYQT